MGRATGKPSKKGDFSDISKLPRGLLDMFAAAGKGATQGAIGLPGDIESLARMGYGWATDTPQTDNVLPATEDVKRYFDERVPLGYESPYETLGEYVAPGIYGKVASKAYNGSKALTNRFKKTHTLANTHNPMRRNFMKAGAAATAAAVAGKYLKHAEGFAKPAAKAAGNAAPAAKTTVKAASKYKFDSVSDYVKHLEERTRKDILDDIEWQKKFWDGPDPFPEGPYEAHKWDEVFRSHAELDAKNYERAKELVTEGIYTRPDGKFVDREGNLLREEFINKVDEFSPKARAEMKMFKKDWEADEIARSYPWADGLRDYTGF
jgi:hypothetical protein